MPLYHCFGMVLGNLACTTHGAAMVYPAEAFDPEATLAAVQAERCTSLYGVPTSVIAALPLLSRLDQPVDLAGGDAVDVGLLDDRDQGLLGAPARLQKAGK